MKDVLSVSVFSVSELATVKCCVNPCPCPEVPGSSTGRPACSHQWPQMRQLKCPGWSFLGPPAGASLTCFLFQGRTALPFSLCVRIFFKDLITCIYLKTLLGGWLHWTEGTLMAFVWVIWKGGFCSNSQVFCLPISFTWKHFFFPVLFIISVHCVWGFFCYFLLFLKFHKHVCIMSKMVKKVS